MRPRAAASKPAVVPMNCLGHRAVPVHANASAFLQGSGARPSKAELKKAKKAANAKAKAEVAAAMKELDEQRIVRVPVLDVEPDIEEAEEDADAVPAPLGPTTKGFEWSGGFGQSTRGSSAAGGCLEF